MAFAATAVLLFTPFVFGSIAPGQVSVHPLKSAARQQQEHTPDDLIAMSCGKTIEGSVVANVGRDQLMILSFTLDETTSVSLTGCESEFGVHFFVNNDLNKISTKESSRVIDGSCHATNNYQDFTQGTYYVGVRSPVAVEGNRFVISMSCNSPATAKSLMRPPPSFPDTNNGEIPPNSLPPVTSDPSVSPIGDADAPQQNEGDELANPPSVVCGQVFSGSTYGTVSHFSGQPAGDAVYSFTLSQPATVRFDGCASSYDTVFYVLDTAWGQLAVSDDSSCGLQSNLETTLHAGTYYFVVDGFGHSTGSFSVDFTCSVQQATRSAVPTPSRSASKSPSTSTFDAYPTASCGNVYSGSTSGAANHYTGQAAGDAVYQFSLSTKTTVTFNGCASSFDTYFYIVNSNWGLVASDDDSASCGSKSVLQVTLNAGSYYFVVDGYGQNTGAYSVSFSCSTKTPTPTPTPTPVATPTVVELTYHSGPVMLGQVNVYLIWYGNWASNTANNAFTSYTRHFVQNVGRTPWYNILSSYRDASGNHPGSNVVLAGEIVDNYSAGTTVDGSNLFSIVQRSLSRFPASSNAVYFVIPSSDVNVPGLCSSWCGYHTWGYSGSTVIKHALVPDATKCGYSCGVASSGASLSGNHAADAFMSVFAHELVESVSDPQGNGYIDTRGQENADKCAWTFGNQFFTSSGAVANMNIADSSGNSKPYKIQQNWVLASGSVHGHCALSL
jgi:hypothetical protein